MEYTLRKRERRETTSTEKRAGRTSSYSEEEATRKAAWAIWESVDYTNKGDEGYSSASSADVDSSIIISFCSHKLDSALNDR